MNWKLVPLAQVAARPWRNGGGKTRELLAWPAPADWRVRMSVADVATDGPFSAFPGIERWFAVLEGEGVELSWPGERHRLEARSPPLCFDGGLAVHCSLLAGATRDFNLMARPGRAQLRRIGGEQRLACAAGSLVALYAHHEAASIDAVAVPAATLAWQVLDEARSFHVSAAEALWTEVLP